MNTIFGRQESESGSEGSGSSQSDSESDDNDNVQPAQMQQRYQVPRLSHFNPAPSMQMSSPPGYPQHSFNNNPTTPTKKNKFDERVSVCVVYSEVRHRAKEDAKILGLMTTRHNCAN